MESYQPSKFSEYQNQPIIVSPNIGIPKMLANHNKNELDENEYIFMTNIIGKKDLLPITIMNQLDNTLFAVPLYDLDSETKKLIRGERIPVNIILASETRVLMNHDNPLSELYGIQDHRPSFLIRHNFFGENMTIFAVKVKLNIGNSPQVLEWLQNRAFIMFDLHQVFPDLDPSILRICYHSIVIHSAEWDTFNFAQITDLHLSKRYDEVIGMISKKMPNIMQNQGPNGPMIQDLIKRYINPNNGLREFNLWANNEYRNGKLDFAFVTGDILDYCMKNSVRNRKAEEYELENTNWDIFLRILLNDPIELRMDCNPCGISPNEEISIPIFTCAGNHDVRVNGYPITTGKYYKFFGLTYTEASAYSDPYKLSEVKALVIDKYCLKPYYQFINPFDDYFLKFGSKIFVILNSGSDNFLSIRNLLMANPASVGFSSKQYKFLSHLAKKYMTENNPEISYFLVCHGPILNPMYKNPFLRGFLKFFGSQMMRLMRPMEYYKERNLKKLNFKDVRADQALHFNYGTITGQWVQVLSLMLQYGMIGLHGHTHRNREFRYILSGQELGYIKNEGRIVRNPFFIYWDDYTSAFTIEYLEKNRPFELQTPSLGIRHVEEQKKYHGFRLIGFENDKLKTMAVHYLDDIKRSTA